MRMSFRHLSSVERKHELLDKNVFILCDWRKAEAWNCTSHWETWCQEQKFDCCCLNTEHWVLFVRVWCKYVKQFLTNSVIPSDAIFSQIPGQGSDWRKKKQKLSKLSGSPPFQQCLNLLLIRSSTSTPGPNRPVYNHRMSDSSSPQQNKDPAMVRRTYFY